VLCAQDSFTKTTQQMGTKQQTLCGPADMRLFVFGFKGIQTHVLSFMIYMINSFWLMVDCVYLCY